MLLHTVRTLRETTFILDVSIRSDRASSRSAENNNMTGTCEKRLKSWVCGWVLQLLRDVLK